MGWAPEDQLLLQCARAEMGDEAIDTASRLLRGRLDWDYLLEASIRHGLSPLLHAGLNQVRRRGGPGDTIPGRILSDLERLSRGSQARNWRLYRALGGIAREMEAAGIPVMGLKDILLARQVYPEVGLRPIGDIDLLIHREDRPKAADRLAGLGFRPVPGPDIPFTLKYAWACNLHRRSDDVWVDLQWNVVQREWDLYHEGSHHYDIGRLWRGASPVTMDHYRLQAPAPEDMLLQLCLHMESHFHRELILLCDVAELLRHSGDRLDWEGFLRHTRTQRAVSSVDTVLRLARRLLGAPLPPFLLRELQPAYFQAGLFAPLFGNLAALHRSLDQIRLVASPPDGVMNAFEAVVRRQATATMQSFKEISSIAAAFVDSGGGLIVMDGMHSEKVLPDPSLRPFGDVHVLIHDRDWPRMRQVLLGRGFNLTEAAGAVTLRKEWDFKSADPVLAGPSRWPLKGEWEGTPAPCWARRLGAPPTRGMSPSGP